MSDKQRAAHIKKMHAIQEEMKTAGPIHRKDLARQLRGMERDLREYDRLRRM